MLPASNASVSVADVWRVALPPGTRALQGVHALHQPVTWARAFMTRPWAISAIEDGAMVILSLRGLSRSEVQTLPRLVDALIAANVSSIVLSDESTAVSEAVSRDATLPVFVLPPESSPSDVERSVI